VLTIWRRVPDEEGIREGPHPEREPILDVGEESDQHLGWRRS